MSAVGAIIAKVPSRLLMTLYRTGTFCNHDDLLRQVAQARGKLKRGGTADSEGAARIVLADWRDGKLPFHTLPPSRGNEKHEHAAIVSQYSQELDINAVIIQEEKHVLAKLDNEFDMQGALMTVCASTKSIPIPGRLNDYSWSPILQAVPAQKPLMSKSAVPMAADYIGDAMEITAVGDGCAVPGSGTGQGRILYSEHGQRNPASAKAAKKRAQKAKTRTAHTNFPG